MLARLATLDRNDADLNGLDAPLAEARAALDAAALSLSVARQQASKAFARAVRSRLKTLGLAGAAGVVVETPAAGGSVRRAAADRWGRPR